MAGEKRSEEERVEKGDDAAAGVVNQEVRELRTVLASLYGDGDDDDGDGGGGGGDENANGGGGGGGGGGGKAACRLDGCSLYLYALVLEKCRQPAEARRALVASVRRTPCNWSGKDVCV
jgi:hypothetical protein